MVGFDLDRTLVEHNGTAIPDRFLETLAGLGDNGIRTYVASNANSPERIKRAHDLTAAAAGASGYPLPCFTTGEYGGRKKPHVTVLDAAALDMGFRGGNGMYVGDQLLKDGAVGWLACGGTILVAPYGTEDHFGVKILQRPAELLIRACMSSVPTRTANFPEQMVRLAPMPDIVPEYAAVPAEATGAPIATHNSPAA